MFLNADQLRELTGLVQPAAQARWLRDRGYRHTRTAAGGVALLRSEVERHLLGGSANGREPRVKLEALR